MSPSIPSTKNKYPASWPLIMKYWAVEKEKNGADDHVIRMGIGYEPKMQYLRSLLLAMVLAMCYVNLYGTSQH